MIYLEQGNFAYTDAMIGATTIDLEDRLFGNLRRQSLEALAVYQDMAKKELSKEERKNPDKPNKAAIAPLKKQLEEIQK